MSEQLRGLDSLTPEDWDSLNKSSTSDGLVSAQTHMKQDHNKVDLALITPEMMLSLGSVLTFGKNKYSARGWEKGIEEDRLVSALLRHLTAYRSGEFNDPESGLSHLDHIFANAGFLVTLKRRGLI